MESDWLARDVLLCTGCCGRAGFDSHRGQTKLIKCHSRTKGRCQIQGCTYMKRFNMLFSAPRNRLYMSSMQEGVHTWSMMGCHLLHYITDPTCFASHFLYLYLILYNRDRAFSAFIWHNELMCPIQMGHVYRLRSVHSEFSLNLRYSGYFVSWVHLHPLMLEDNGSAVNMEVLTGQPHKIKIISEDLPSSH